MFPDCRPSYFFCSVCFSSRSTSCFSLLSLVSVSVPKITVVGSAVLGKPIKILCQSDAGSLPINYTLLKGYGTVDTATVRLPSQKAVFTVNITRADELKGYMCEAKNRRKDKDEGQLSSRLNASVIGKCVCHLLRAHSVHSGYESAADLRTS